jgi:tetratricopeptide (TPR) repeat protein
VRAKRAGRAALKPDYDAAALELAKAELALGCRAAEAVLEPLRRRTQWADVHALLGRARLLRGAGWRPRPRCGRRSCSARGYASARADLGWALLAQGRSREADEEFARARELDPLNALPRQQLEWRELMAAKGEGAA